VAFTLPGVFLNMYMIGW